MEKKVQGPAMGLIVIGGLGMLAFLFALVRGPEDPQEMIRRLTEGGMPEDEARQIAGFFGAGLLWAVSITAILVCAFVIWAGSQMLKLRSWIACVIASVLVMVPCFTSCCCLLGIPFGIWGLVVLFNAEVKRAFQGGGGATPPAFTT